MYLLHKYVLRYYFYDVYWVDASDTNILSFRRCVNQWKDRVSRGYVPSSRYYIVSSLEGGLKLCLKSSQLLLAFWDGTVVRMRTEIANFRGLGFGSVFENTFEPRLERMHRSGQ